MREYSYGHSNTKAKINAIFNSHFYGSVLWNLFGNEVNMIYNTWNTSIRKMFRLDRGSHRYLIEPFSKTQHIKTAFLKRLTNFTEKLSCSAKLATKSVFNIMKNDCRSATGMNLRTIMLLCNKSRICEATANDVAKIPYQVTPPQKEEWRVCLIEELLDIRDGLLTIDNWSMDEILTMLDYLCTT